VEVRVGTRLLSRVHQVSRLGAAAAGVPSLPLGTAGMLRVEALPGVGGIILLKRESPLKEFLRALLKEFLKECLREVPGKV